MEWTFSDGQREHRIALSRKDRDFKVQIGKRSYAARVLLHAPPRLTLLINNRHVIEADAIWKNGNCSLTIDNIPYTISVTSDSRLVTRKETCDVRRETCDVLAPLPGRIVDIMVAPGDMVSEGQPVCIIEAMKMQNEIFASTSGTVAEILVKPGQAVEGGTLLIRCKS